MITVADFLCAGMKLPEIEQASEKLPTGAHDALFGQEIKHGYQLWDIAPDSMGEMLDALHGNMDGYLSESSSRMFKNCWNMGSWLVFEDGTGYHPLINRMAASEQERPCWSDLVYPIWQERCGQRFVCILTTDVKKRVWTRARLGVLGHKSDVFLYDNDYAVSGNFILNWEVMLDDLKFVEMLYQVGFTKPGIGSNLLRELNAATRIGLTQAIRHESRLRDLRGNPEWIFAMLIAQKGAKSETTGNKN